MKKEAVNEDLIKHVASIARLKLDKKEIEEFLPQLKEILDYFELVKSAKANNEPSIQPVKMKNALRKDKVKESLPQELVLSLSDHKKDGYFKGPRVI